MAKSKSDEPAVDESLVQGPDGPITIEKMDRTIVQTIQPPSKAFRFEILAGMHMVGGTLSDKGSIVESDDDLVAIYGSNKFRRLE